MTTLAFPMTTLSIYVVPAGRDTKSRMNKLVKKKQHSQLPFPLTQSPGTDMLLKPSPAFPAWIQQTSFTLEKL